MKTIIAGSRTITDYSIILESIKNSGFNISEIVSGGAKGVDHLGEKYADENNKIVCVFKPDWKRYGRGAGPVRNRQMAEYADVLIAIWDGKSRGTKNMIFEMQKQEKVVYVFQVS